MIRLCRVETALHTNVGDTLDDERRPGGVALGGGGTHGTITLTAEHTITLDSGAVWPLPVQTAAVLGDTLTAIDFDAHCWVTYLDVAGVFTCCAQEHLYGLAATADLWPLHYIHAPEIKRFQRRTPPALFALYDGNLGTHAYGMAGVGVLPFPSLTLPGPGLVGANNPRVTSNRMASHGGALLLVLPNGNLTCLADPHTPAGAVVVTLPRFAATDVRPRCLGVNANSDLVGAGWYALVEFDAGLTTYEGLYVLKSIVPLPTHAADWTIVSTLRDMATPMPSGIPAVPGMTPEGAIVSPRPPTPWPEISGTLLLNASGSGYYGNFDVGYSNSGHDGRWGGGGLLWGLRPGYIWGYFADGTIWIYNGNPTRGNFPQPVTPGIYTAYARPRSQDDPWHQLTIVRGTTVPDGCAAFMRLEVIGKSDNYFQGDYSQLGIGPILIQNPLELPGPDRAMVALGDYHPADEETGGRWDLGIGTNNYVVSGITASVDPSLPTLSVGNVPIGAIYPGGGIFIRTQDFWLSPDNENNENGFPYADVCSLNSLGMGISIYAAGNESVGPWTYTFSAHFTVSFNGTPYSDLGPSTFWGYDINWPQLAPPPGPPFPNPPAGSWIFNHAIGNFLSGPKILGTPIFGSPAIPGPAPMHVLGIGPHGETLLQDDLGVFRYEPGGAIMPYSNLIAATYTWAVFGDGTPSPAMLDLTISDEAGGYDTTQMLIACVDDATGIMYGVQVNGSLKSRTGPAGTPWAVVCLAIVPPATAFDPMALRVRKGVVQLIYGAANKVYLASYTLATAALSLSAPTAFPTYETTLYAYSYNSTYRTAAFLPE